MKTLPSRVFPNGTLLRSLVLGSLVALAVFALTQMSAPGKIAYAAGTYTGTVFIDYDADGTQDSNEPGQSGINIGLFDANGNSCTTTSDSTGSWSINSGTCGGLSAGPYRVEFTIPSALSYFKSGPVGTNNATSVVFVADGGATVNFGLMSPDEYAGAATVPLVTSNNSNPGASATKTNSSSNPTVLGWPYNSTGSSGNPNSPDPTTSISFSDVGSTWGLGIQRSNLRAYFAAALLRHVDLGPAARPTTGAGEASKAVDGVYMVDMSSTSGTLAGYFTLNGINPSSGDAGAINLGSVTRKIITASVNTGGTLGTNQDLNALSTTSDASFDRDAFGKVATMGFGGAEVSSDDKYLWLVNLNQKSLIRVDITNYSALPTSGGTPSASLVSHYAISTSGLSACGSGGTYRPWGLKLYRGRGYVGITCDVLNAQGTADAWVRSFDLNDPTAGFTTEVSIDLSRNTSGGASGYSREQTNNTVNTNTTFANRWNDWLNSFDDRTGIAYETTGTNWEASRPQALIGDIEFTDNGDMVIGMLDRFGMQSGFLNYSTNPADDTSGNQQLYSGNAGGDLIHACRTGSGFVVEGFTGCVIDNDTGPQSSLTNDGPNSVGEYYYDDYAYFGTSVTHFEVATGGLAVRRSTTEVVSTVYDPITSNANYQQGVRWYDTNTASGNSTRGTALRIYQAWPISAGNISKANGLGDLEQLNVAPIEIGNRVWNDTNGNGIQDPGEVGISGVTVQLWADTDGNGTVDTQIGTATTNSSGEYYFGGVNSTNVPSGSITRQISQSSDDAEQTVSSGAMSLTGNTLSIPQEGSTDQLVGLRFQNLTIPQGAVITSAQIQFTANNNQTSSTVNVTVRGQAADNPGTFTTGNNNLGGRSTTSSSVAWSNIPGWSSNEVGSDTTTPNLSSIVQEIVNRAGWASGNSMVFVLSENSGNTSQRDAFSFDNSSANAATLTVTYGYPISPNTAYEIRIPTTQSALTSANLTLTTPNTDSSANGDARDSDAVQSGSNAVISHTTGSAGSNDHTLDAGFHLPMDFGDAPDTGSGTGTGNYNTLASDNGPRHVIVSGVRMGATIDADTGLLQNSNATADDITDTGSADDEDGVALPANVSANQTFNISITVAGAGGRLNAWIDWNRDGDFNDANEQIALNVQDNGSGDNNPSTGTIQLSVTAPAGASLGTTVARFRWSTTSNLGPTGYAADGEVEDYQITIGSATATGLGDTRAVVTPKQTVRVKWTSLNEINALGFNVQRSAKRNGEYANVNAELIAARDPGNVSGNAYRFVDKTAEAGKTYFYRVEMALTNDMVERSEPIKVQVPNATTCTARPKPPALGTPADGKKVKKGKVTFTWDAVECAASYRWQLRMDSPEGQLVATKNDLTTFETSIKKLQPGATYVWRAAACNADTKCKWSDWRSIQVRAPKESQAPSE